MSASDHLSPQQFFHGTAARLQPGDHIEPGRPSNYEEGRSKSPAGQYVFSSESPIEAYGYARSAAGVREDEFFDRTGRYRQRRVVPRVYEVEHTGPKETDPEWNAKGWADWHDEPEPIRYRSKAPLRVVRDVTSQTHRAYERETGMRGY